MIKEHAKQYILQSLNIDDVLIGFFQAQNPVAWWMFLVLGPFALLYSKTFFVAISNQGVYLYKFSVSGRFIMEDFIPYEELAHVKIGRGFMQRPISFIFNNGIIIKLRAQIKGVEKVAKLDSVTQKHIERSIKPLV